MFVPVAVPPPTAMLPLLGCAAFVVLGLVLLATMRSSEGGMRVGGFLVVGGAVGLLTAGATSSPGRALTAALSRGIGEGPAVAVVVVCALTVLVLVVVGTVTYAKR